MDDIQKPSLYAWEDLFSSFGKRSETRSEIKSLIGRACRLYGVEPPAVHFVSRVKSPTLTRTTWYDPSNQSISMGYRSCNDAIALHEASHAIVDDLYESVEDHGPEFLGVYFDLLAWARVIPKSAIHASARELGLRWKPATRASKKAR